MYSELFVLKKRGHRRCDKSRDAAGQFPLLSRWPVPYPVVGQSVFGCVVLMHLDDGKQFVGVRARNIKGVL